MMPVAVRERWIAVAFSHDVEMGDDSVTECMVDTQGSVKVYNSYNKAKTNHRLDNKIVGLSKMEGSFVNGLLECKFHRNKTSSYEPKLFDLNKLWYIMFSDGDALAERKFAHRFDIPPPVTSCKVDLRTTAVYVQDTNCLSPERPPESLDGISAGSGYLHVTWFLLILACDVVWLTLPL